MNDSSKNASSADFEMNEESHFPFSICDLIFVIAGGNPDSMPSEHWAIYGAMTNIKSQMENGK